MDSKFGNITPKNASYSAAKAKEPIASVENVDGWSWNTPGA